jgi:methionyl-tRNA synthetase
MSRFLVTGALPYSNGRLHVGHIGGAYLPADVYVRYLRARGHQVRFICGSDDNGVAIPITALEKSSTPQEICTHYNRRQQADFEGLGIHFDVYGGTHHPDFVEMHNRICRHFFKTIFEEGYFTKKTTKQLYDAQADQFLPDRYVKGTCHHCNYDGAFGDQCEQCGAATDPLLLGNPLSVITGTKPVVRETTHWYMRLDKFEDRLRDWLESKRDPQQAGAHWRETVLNFSLGQVKSGLPERAMTRDLDWGVPVPLDDPDAAGKVLYVWFDAPIGYVSFTARHCELIGEPWEGYERWWKDPDCKIVHFIGEDNTIFHALTWPAMLMAEGSFQLPHNVVANAFINIKFPGKEEEKISKSRGTAIWIEEYLKMLDPDPLRYYLTAIAPESQRTAFDIDEFVQRNNSELIANLGNFFNRWQKIITEDFQRKVPALDESGLSEEDRSVLAGTIEGRKVAERVGVCLDECRFKDGLKRVMEFGQACNKWINDAAPWRTRKSDRNRTAQTLHICVQASYRLATVMYPFMPFSASKVLRMLGADPDAVKWDQADTPIPAGTELPPLEMLFRKLDPDKVFPS